MNYDKNNFDTPEFRELLKKYEQASAMNMSIYLGIDEFAEILSYYLYQDKTEKAEEVLDMAKALHPTADECIKMEARLLLGNNEPQKAFDLLSKAKYSDSETSILIAESLLGLKNFKAAHDIAISLIEKAQMDDGDIYEALEILLDCGSALEALFICETSLARFPDRRNLLEIKAECFIELQRIDEAIDIYNRLLDENPYSTFYWEQLGHIYYMVKRYGKAIECFEFESTINDEIEYARMMLAYCCYFAGDYKRSAETFQWFAGKYPESVMPRFYIALSLYHQNRPEDALNAFKEIIDIAPEGTIEMMLARINKAMLLDLMGKGNRGDETIAMAIMMHPDNMKQLLLHETHLYELRDKENLTFSDMNILEQKEWTIKEEMYEWGVHLAEHNHLKLALRVFKHIRSMFKDTTEVDAYIAYIIWNTGEKENAMPAIESAINGKSCLLFKLFGIAYSSNITPEEFYRNALANSK